MSATINLNNLVTLGRDEIIHYLRQALPFPEAKKGENKEKHIAGLTTPERLNFILFTELRIVMRALQRDVDVERIREAVIEQNSELLANSEGGARDSSAAMAQGWGRMAQIQDAVIAIGRLCQTYVDSGEEVLSKLDELETDLMVMECTCLRMGRGEDGFLYLHELDSAMAAADDQQDFPALRLVHSA